MMFRQSVSEILGGWNPPGCEMGPKSLALLGLKNSIFTQGVNWFEYSNITTLMRA